MGDSVSDLVSEWVAEAHRHPSFGEGKGLADMSAIWDSAAATYSSAMYDQNKSKIITDLSDMGILEGRSVVDIGCGPGTFTIPLSSISCSVLGVDSSEGMIRRLDASVREAGIRNVDSLVCPFEMMDSSCARDVSFVSLCPPVNDPETLLSLERFGREYCIYISSNSVGSSVETEIWHALGKDYSYSGYNTVYPFRYLEMMGRKPELRYYEQCNPSDTPVDVMVSRYVSKIGKYRTLEDDSIGIIREVVESLSMDGSVHFEGRMKMGMVIWEPDAW